MGLENYLSVQGVSRLYRDSRCCMDCVLYADGGRRTADKYMTAYQCCYCHEDDKKQQLFGTAKTQQCFFSYCILSLVEKGARCAGQKNSPDSALTSCTLTDDDLVDGDD
jgi:hypothetical protein